MKTRRAGVKHIKALNPTIEFAGPTNQAPPIIGKWFWGYLPDQLAFLFTGWNWIQCYTVSQNISLFLSSGRSVGHGGWLWPGAPFFWFNVFFFFTSYLTHWLVSIQLNLDHDWIGFNNNRQIWGLESIINGRDRLLKLRNSFIVFRFPDISLNLFIPISIKYRSGTIRPKTFSAFSKAKIQSGNEIRASATINAQQKTWFSSRSLRKGKGLVPAAVYGPRSSSGVANNNVFTRGTRSHTSNKFLRAMPTLNQCKGRPAAEVVLFVHHWTPAHLRSFIWQAPQQSLLHLFSSTIAYPFVGWKFDRDRSSRKQESENGKRKRGIANVVLRFNRIGSRYVLHLLVVLRSDYDERIFSCQGVIFHS